MVPFVNLGVCCSPQKGAFTQLWGRTPESKISDMIYLSQKMIYEDSILFYALLWLVKVCH